MSSILLPYFAPKAYEGMDGKPEQVDAWNRVADTTHFYLSSTGVSWHGPTVNRTVGKSPEA